MSGSHPQRRPPPVIPTSAINVLAEARGEVRQAQGHMMTLMDFDHESQAHVLILSIQSRLEAALHVASLTDLESLLEEVQESIRECVRLLEQFTCPPTTQWHHQRQLAVNWLSCSLGRFKVALAYVKLDRFMRGQASQVRGH